MMTNQRLVGTTVALILTAGLGAAVVAQPVTDIGMAPEARPSAARSTRPF